MSEARAYVIAGLSAIGAYLFGWRRCQIQTGRG